MTTPTGVVLQQAFEERNRKLLFKKSHAKSIKIDLRNIILLDVQSNMDLLFNPKLVGNIYKAKKNMYLQSNGGKMIITNKAQVAGYKPHVWFDQKYITNLIALKNLMNQYCITYDNLDEICIVHIEEHGNHNMQFRMHESGLHHYNPEDENFVFVNTVVGKSKVTASNRSRLLNRQGNFMSLLVTHQLNNTSGSYRAIKSRIF